MEVEVADEGLAGVTPVGILASSGAVQEEMDWDLGKSGRC
jgi:hypothetical protein